MNKKKYLNCILSDTILKKKKKKRKKKNTPVINMYI